MLKWLLIGLLICCGGLINWLMVGTEIYKESGLKVLKGLLIGVGLCFWALAIMFIKDKDGDWNVLSIVYVIAYPAVLTLIGFLLRRSYAKAKPWGNLGKAGEQTEQEKAQQEQQQREESHKAFVDAKTEAAKITAERRDTYQLADEVAAQYEQAMFAKLGAVNDKEYKIAASKFQAISGVADADQQTQECFRLAMELRKDAILETVQQKLNSASPVNQTEQTYRNLMLDLRTISGWKNADKLAAECAARLEALEQQASKKRGRRR